MATDMLCLSNEMLDRIFSFLSEDKPAIGACRLACRLFKDLSSPYLITRVVFARRLKTIVRLNEIMEHDYFHRYVTEMACDVSSFCLDTAMDWDTYRQRCLDAPQGLGDAEWAQKRREDQAIWSTIGPLTDDKDGAISASMQLAKGDHDAEGIEAEDRDQLGEDVEDDSSDDSDWDDELGDMNTNSLESELDHLRLFDDVFNRGCHKSFRDYYRFYNNQARIDQNRVAQHTIAKAVSKCKKLKSIVITDWRGLARPGESYADCARRLFGNTLAPDLMRPESAGSSLLIDKLMQTVGRSKDNRIEQLSAASHHSESEHAHAEPNDPQVQMYIPIYTVFDMSTTVHMLRQLRLSIDIDPEWLELERVPGDSDRLIHATLAEASDLKHLTLAIRLPEVSRGLVDIEKRKIIFSSCLADQKYFQLQSLDLQGWVFEQVLLEAFLTRHASTLRAVHFTNCHLIGDQVSLARWASKTLNLDGIEIDLISFTDVYYIGDEADGIRAEIPVDTALLPENESLWLDSRQNFIARKRVIERVREDEWTSDGTQWWQKKDLKQRHYPAFISSDWGL